MQLFFILFSILIFNSCQKKNSPSKLLVISIDGYRWDYTEKFSPPFLTKFKSNSAHMDSLIPTFPTKTFPNHLSIMTGSYPKNHGIVGNSFYAPDLHQYYSLRKSESVTNGDFYQRLPLWTILEQQGIKTATYFWPGSEARIQNILPSTYKVYDKSASHEDRINTIKKWNDRLDIDAPRFMTLYFSDVDQAGHTYATESKEVRDAVLKVDNSLKDLITYLKDKDSNITIIILSDHGMSDLQIQNNEYLFKGQSLHLSSLYYLEGNGPIVHLYKKENIITNTFKDIQDLNKEAKNFNCYSNLSTPKELNFSHNQRIGDIVCIANKHSNILSTEDAHLPRGNHGWSADVDKDMHAIFYAQGPLLKKSYKHKSTSNIHLFPLFIKILNANFSNEIDGEYEEVKDLFKD